MHTLTTRSGAKVSFFTADDLLEANPPESEYSFELVYSATSVDIVGWYAWGSADGVYINFGTLPINREQMEQSLYRFFVAMRLPF